MEILESLKKIQIEVANGQNFFTMKRGSFSYKQKISKKRKLIFKEIIFQETENFKLCFLDPLSQKNCSLRISKKNDFIYLDFEGKISNVNRFWIKIPCEKNEHFYGCGETYSEFDLSGKTARIWVAEHQNAKRIAQKIILEKLTGTHPHHTKKFSKYESYYAQPTFVSSRKYFVHAFTNAYAEFDFKNSKTKGEISLYLQEEPHAVLGFAQDFQNLSFKLSEILGRQKNLPNWIYDGVILAVQRGTKTIDEKLALAKKSGVKVAGIWAQDWCGCRKTGFGYQVMWNWQSDEEGQYPHLKEKISEWKRQGIHFLGYINPFIALEKNLYKVASKNGFCVKDKNGNDYLVKITTFPAAMVDFTNPKAYEWYKSLIKENMIGIGMSAWMADFGEYLPIDAVLFDGSNPEEIHNQWPSIWAKLNQEAIEECEKQDEIFFFTRAGHTKTISYSNMMWTGDQHVDWSVDDGIASVIPSTLSLAMSGFGITHSDVGGYTTIMQMRRSKELLMRWEEMCVFSPLWRSHEGNQPVNNVQFDDDDELLNHFAKCSKMHKALKDYLKFLVDENAKKGIPVMRPLFYHYDEEKAFLEKSEYLLGKDLLVCPILDKGKFSRLCYLPNDEWINIFSKKEYSGGTFEINAEFAKPPVFVRKTSEWKNFMLKLSDIENL